MVYRKNASRSKLCATIIQRIQSWNRMAGENIHVVCE